jgi:two-component system, LuxR family, response regulator FixJ
MSEPVVHVIDDDDAVRDSLAFLLESAGFRAVTHESAVVFLNAHPGHAFGCVITDIRMPEMSGLELVQKLNESGAAYPVIVITGHGDVPLAVEAMKGGVVDFIEKPFEDELILSAVRAALRRISETATQAELRQEVVSRVATLSAREREVLQGLIAGRPNKVIAFDLGISPRTVEVYRANVMTKMQAASLSDLVRMALLAGLI